MALARTVRVNKGLRGIMRKRFLVIIIIISLVVLTGHIHFHHCSNDDEFHCPLCALLNTGLGFSLPFKLFVSLALLNMDRFDAVIKLSSGRIFANQFRAPPFYFTKQCSKK
jgi:hypothetical protein